MALMSIFRNARRLGRDSHGNVAMITGIVLLPIVAIMGFAVDLSITGNNRDSVGKALDAAILSAARARLQGLNDQQVESQFQTYFGALTGDAPGRVTCETPELVEDGIDMVARTTCTSQSMIAGATGKQYVTFDVESRVTFGIGKLDIAFVFDVSGSMGWSSDDSTPGAPSRIDALKTAARTGVNNLLRYNTGDTDDIRIAMVGYSSAVHGGEYFNYATGLNPTRSFHQDVVRGEWQRVCTRWRYGRCWQSRWRWVSSTETVSTTITDYCTYERNSSEWNKATEPRAGHYLSSGRPEYNDYYDSWDSPNSCNSSGQPRALDTNQDNINSYINGLTANGGTAGHLGIAWGRYLISPEWADAFDTEHKPLDWDEPDSQKIIILMTDGEFNSQYHGNLGSSYSQAQAQCDDAKNNDGVLIYTIAFNAPPAGQDILDYCSSGGEFRFDANNGQELLDAYTAIAASISDLRLVSSPQGEDMDEGYPFGGDSGGAESKDTGELEIPT